MPERVVVGVDTTVISDATLRWLQQRSLAALDGLDVELVTVAPTSEIPAGTSAVEQREVYESALRRSELLLASRLPDGRIRGTVSWGFPVEHLIKATERGGILVVETERTPKPRDHVHDHLLTRLGEVSGCPLVIIPTEWDAPLERIIVGLAFTLSDAAVLDFAARQALHHHLPMVLVHATDEPPAIAPGPEARRQDAETILGRHLADLAARLPRLSVSTVVLPGHPAAALLDEAGQTSLLVVGARRSDGLPPQLGSVNHALISGIRCPLAIVPRADID